MSDKNKEQIMDELFVLASKFSKIVSKGGLGDIWGEVNKIQEDQIKYFLLQDYYFAAPSGLDQYTFSWLLLDYRQCEVNKQIQDLIKDYDYRNIDNPDNKNKKSFFDITPFMQDYAFNELGKEEVNNIIYAMEFEKLDLFDKLSPNVQKKILALNSDLAEKISNRNEYRKSEFKGRTAEEVQKDIDNCCGFYKFEQNLYRRKDRIYNDSEVSDGEWKYFYEEDAKGVINQILSVDPEEIDKLLELGLETSEGASWGVRGKEIKIKDALAMIVEMFPSLFFKLPIELQDKILDHKYEKGSRSVRESVRFYVEIGSSLNCFLPVITENFLTEDEKKWKRKIEELDKIDKDNSSSSEKKEKTGDEAEPSDNQNSKSETKLNDDPKKEIPMEKPEDKEKQGLSQKPNEKNNEPENIYKPEVEYEGGSDCSTENKTGHKSEENKDMLPEEEAHNKIKSITSQVDKFLEMNGKTFSFEEIKKVLKTAIELAYAIGRFDGCRENRSKYLEDVKNSDEITIRNFFAVFFAVLFDSKKSIFRKIDWKRAAFEKNITSVMKKLKGKENLKVEKMAVPAQATHKITPKRDEFI